MSVRLALDDDDAVEVSNDVSENVHESVTVARGEMVLELLNPPRTCDIEREIDMETVLLRDCTWLSVIHVRLSDEVRLKLNVDEPVRLTVNVEATVGVTVLVAVDETDVERAPSEGEGVTVPAPRVGVVVSEALSLHEPFNVAVSVFSEPVSIGVMVALVVCMSLMLTRRVGDSVTVAVDDSEFVVVPLVSYLVALPLWLTVAVLVPNVDTPIVLLLLLETVTSCVASSVNV